MRQTGIPVTTFTHLTPQELEASLGQVIASVEAGCPPKAKDDQG